MKDQQLNLVSKTFSGLESVLADELAQLGAENTRIVKRAVEFTGDIELIYKTNLWSRTAINVLNVIYSFEVHKQEDLYDGLRQIDWDKYFDHSKTIAVNAVIFNTVFDNSHFVALKSKDAIVDHFSDKHGSRPNVDTSDPGIKISVHLSNNICKVSIDSSGQPLFKRNYRKSPGEAPINEVLAAGLIKLTGWKTDTPLIDPMCGSGTIPIEASMMAQNIAPGLFRDKFGFQNWKDFNPQLLENLKKQAKDVQKPIGKTIIEAHDIDGKNTGIARSNILRSGLMGTIKLQRNDFFKYKPALNNGMLIMNPPYGKRMQKNNLIDFYKNIGDTLKNKYKGFSAWIISQDHHPSKFIGLKPSKKIAVFNGPLECSYMKFEIFQGSYNKQKHDKNEQGWTREKRR